MVYPGEAHPIWHIDKNVIRTGILYFICLIVACALTPAPPPIC